jgi:endonuclease/exonuclease/phosphatase family metal-dependent hydrolase
MQDCAANHRPDFAPRLAALCLIVLEIACSDRAAPLAAIDPGKPTPANVLDILTYNVFLRAPSAFFRDGQDWRVEHIPAAVTGHDVVVFQEAFSDAHRERLLELLAAAYPYRTRALGHDRVIAQDGGVILLSRWPIVREGQAVFGRTCAGVDCLADKGIVYARIDKLGRIFNVFGAHNQDGAEHRDVREAQYARMKQFIDSFAIPAAEPVVIAGDLDVDMLGQPDAYAAMKRILDASHALPPNGEAHLPSWDGELNPLVASRSREVLDYVLYSNGHQAPVEAFTEVVPFRAEGRVLSDHFAVHGRLEFTERPRASPAR